MVYLYWIGALIVLGALIVALPLLSRNRIYRTATFFAGMNVGIVTFAFFINILRWGPGSSGGDQFAQYFMTSLPNFYIACLLVGSSIVPKYYLDAPTRFGAAIAVLGCLVAIYFLTIIVSRSLSILLMTLFEGLPSQEILSETFDDAIGIAIHPDLSTIVIHLVSGFIALNGTATVMRMSEELTASKNENTGQEEA